MRYLFAFIILVHGLIHFLGFAKAYGYGNITQLTSPISRTAGILWFLTAILFVLGAVLFLLKTTSWPLLLIAASMISQVLIILSWKDAKWGTIANLLVLLVAIMALAEGHFNKSVRQEATILLSQAAADKKILTPDLLTGLPPVVQNWMQRSGVIGKEMVHTVRLIQSGKMRTKPGAKWMDFEAIQYFNVDSPAFVWQTKVKMMPLVYLIGRDRFVNGKGEMRIKIFAMKSIVDVKDDRKIDESSLIRYLAEICWFPSAAINPYIKWEQINHLSAKATMTYKDLTINGIFRFSEAGDLTGFEAFRYYGSEERASFENWIIEAQEYKKFKGVRIPNKCKVIWKLKAGDFDWLQVEIADLEYNQYELYNKLL